MDTTEKTHSLRKPVLYWVIVCCIAFGAAAFSGTVNKETDSAASIVCFRVLPFLSTALSLLPHKPFYRSVFWLHRILLFLGAAAGQCIAVLASRDADFTVRAALWLIPPALSVLLWLVNLLCSRRIRKGSRLLTWLRNAALVGTPHLQKEKKPDAKSGTVSGILFGLLGVLAVFCIGGAGFLYHRLTNMGIQSLLFTALFAEDNGNPHLVLIIVSVVTLLVLVWTLSFVYYKRTRRAAFVTARSLDRSAALRVPVTAGSLRLLRICLWLCVVGGLTYAGITLQVFHYVGSFFTENTLYEDYYVRPEQSLLTFPEQKKNLIYIYAESMENTFTDYANGGDYDVNYIPELIDIEGEGINFSHRDTLGGATVVYDNVSYTMGSTVAQTSGVPLFINPKGISGSVLPGLRRMEDVLHDAGYQQFYLIGSGKKFAKYDTYVARYDDTVLYDSSDARREGYLTDENASFWGVPDYLLLELAKDKLTETAQSGKPFYFSMYTLDTHGVEGGYRCAKCDASIENNYAAAMRCASAHLSAFIRWIQAQDFYKDTVIIMIGDHTAEVVMDKSFIKRDDYTRNIYNVILNSDTVPVNTKNRVFAVNDMFPTALAAIGVQIDGERLGLGTNLFSDKPTLCEELGEAVYRDRITRASDFYDLHFWSK